MVIGFTFTMSAFLATFIRLCALLFGGHDQKARAAVDLNIFTDETNRTADVLAAEARSLAEEIKPEGRGR